MAPIGEVGRRYRGARTARTSAGCLPRPGAHANVDAFALRDRSAGRRRSGRAVSLASPSSASAATTSRSADPSVSARRRPGARWRRSVPRSPGWRASAPRDLELRATPTWSRVVPGRSEARATGRPASVLTSVPADVRKVPTSTTLGGTISRDSRRERAAVVVGHDPWQRRATAADAVRRAPAAGWSSRSIAMGQGARVVHRSKRSTARERVAQGSIASDATMVTPISCEAPRIRCTMRGPPWACVAPDRG